MDDVQETLLDMVSEKLAAAKAQVDATGSQYSNIKKKLQKKNGSNQFQ